MWKLEYMQQISKKPSHIDGGSNDSPPLPSSHGLTPAPQHGMFKTTNASMPSGKVTFSSSR